MVLVGCLIVAWEARHVTFVIDDWEFILSRRGSTAAVFLRPHFGHLSALPVLAYKVLLAVFGLASYAPFMALLIVIHAVVCLSLYALARRYVGPWVALAPTAILALLGPAWQDLIWAFQIGFLGSMAAGLGMALCLERRERRADFAAGVLLGVSLLCSSVGLGMVVLALVMIGSQRPLSWRRFWAVGVPVGLYLLWYASYGVSTFQASNIPGVPGYVFRAASAGVASVTGLAQETHAPYLVSTTYGQFVLVAAVGWFVVSLMRGWRPPLLTWAALTTALALWVGEALEFNAFSRNAEQSRYQYVSAVLLMLVVVSALSDWRPAGRSRVLLAIATLAVCVSNIAMLDQRAGYWSGFGALYRTATGALQITRGVAPVDTPPLLAFLGIRAGPYFSAIDAFGSAAYDPRQILSQPEDTRTQADLVVATAERLTLSPAARGDRAASVCRSAQTGTGIGEMTGAPGSLVIARTSGSSPAWLELRRFASSYGHLRWVIPHRLTVTMRLPVDRASLPWHAQLVGGEGVRLCFAPGR